MYASIFFNFLTSSALYVTLSRSFEIRGFSILTVSGVLAPGIVRMLNYRRIPGIEASYTSTIANSAPIFSEPFGVLNEQTRLQLGMELTRIWMMTRKTIVFRDPQPHGGGAVPYIHAAPNASTPFLIACNVNG
jgi:hypothetical protein